VSKEPGRRVILPARSDKMRVSFARRYGHRAYTGQNSGKSIYLPRELYNALMRTLRRKQREEHTPYKFAYEEVATVADDVVIMRAQDVVRKNK